MVEVYDPAIDVDDPVATIDGSEVPGGGFVFLRDAAVAVDRVSGKVYVADNLQPQFTESPLAAVYVFDAAGTYLGRLKHNVVDALPPGLAVDNSGEATQGRVYVTSGNTEFASVYAYGPTPRPIPLCRRCHDRLRAEAEVRAPRALRPPRRRFRAAGRRCGEGRSGARPEGRPASRRQRRLAPQALPRSGVAPIAVRVGGRIFAVNGGELPQLKTMRIEFNRNGRMQAAGLPTCPAEKIRIASSPAAQRLPPRPARHWQLRGERRPRRPGALPDAVPPCPDQLHLRRGNDARRHTGAELPGAGARKQLSVFGYS